MRFTQSPEDFLKGQLTTPGWNPCKILKAEEGLSKGGINPKTGLEKDKVQMMTVTFQVTEGESKGCLIYQNYPENIPNFMTDLMEQGFGYAVDRKKGLDIDVTPEKLVGKFVDVHVKRGSWNGKPKNEVEGYRKYTGKEA